MNNFNGFCIAALRSGEGKTTVSLALMRLLARKDKRVQAFKCGPDYIDPTFHTLVTDRVCTNVDTWMMGEHEVKRLFSLKTSDADFAVCEGVMGLFDGKIYKNSEQANNLKNNLPNISGSSAHLANILNLPIVLVVNAKGMAASIVALVTGVKIQLEKYGVKLAGIIANNVGSASHAKILKDSLELWSLPPLLGYLPRNEQWQVHERQLGLQPCEEAKKDMDWANSIADALEENLDMEQLLEQTKIARPSFDSKNNCEVTQENVNPKNYKGKTLAIAKDQAFCFYYEANLKALEKLGYGFEFFSPLNDSHLPRADALYLGGGYPEVFAKQLSENGKMRQEIYDFAMADKEIFAECGGYMYLTKELLITKNNEINQSEEIYSMCGVINGIARMGKKMRSLGYRSIELLADTIFYDKSSEENQFRGHEFHWSDIELFEKYAPLALVNGVEQGLSYKNVRASYLHFYFANNIFKTFGKSCL